MTITYRNNKGTALTYDEVDENIRDLYQDTTIDRVLGNGNTTTKSLTIGSITSTGNITTASLTTASLTTTGNVSISNFISTGITDSASATALTINSSGYVGIKTTSPGYPLTVFNTNTPQISIIPPGGSNGLISNIGFWSTFSNYPSDIGSRRSADITSGYNGGTWGTEYLTFNVGSNGPNDAANPTIERMRINGNGAVTKPYQPWIYFRPSSTTSSGYVNLAFGTQTQGAMGNSGVLGVNGTYGQYGITVPVAGIYLMTWQHICNNTGSRIDSYIVLNGSNLTQGLSEDTTTGYHQRTHTIAYKLSVNDFISLYNGNWYNFPNDPGAWSTFSMYLLG